MRIRLKDGSGTIELKYLNGFIDRHGKSRIYFRRRGQKPVAIRSEIGSPAFLAEYQAILSGGRPSDPPISKGTLRWLVTQYYASAAFKSLDQRTRHVRRLILDGICAEHFGAELPHGDKPYGLMETQHVRRIRDVKLDFPEAANSRVKALRQVFRWAMDEEVKLAKDNPAEKVKYLASKNPDGFHTWTVDEIRQYEARHPIGTKARLALDLFLYTGVRRSDVVLLGPQMERDGWLIFTETKGRSRQPKARELPILPQLRFSIDKTPSGHLAYLVTEFGRPFSANGFGNWFHDRCREAGLPHCSAHGLRKAGATIAAENGATEHELMAIFGWESPKQAALYTRKASRKKLAGASLARVVPLENPAHVTNPDAKSDKPVKSGN